jgi:hypothetical protein
VNRPFIGPVRQVQSGFRKRARKYVKMNPRLSSYNQSNDLQSKFCVLKKHSEMFIPANGDILFSVSVAELSTCPQWAYFSGLFNKYKLEFIKVTIHQSGNMKVLYSYATLDTNDDPASINECLKHQNSRKHDAAQDNHAPGRTMMFGRAQDYTDYLDSPDIGAELGVVAGVRGSGSSAFARTNGSKVGSMGFASKGVGSEAISMTIEFGVRFRGLRENIQIT